MHTHQIDIIKALGVKPEIAPATEVQTRVDFLKNYLVESGARAYVLGISGGQDSMLAGRLAQLAVEAARSEDYDAHFFAMKLPYGTQADAIDVDTSIGFVKPDFIRWFNIKSTVDAFANMFYETNDTLSDYHKGNVKARTRMVAQYALAGTVNGLVIGTDHAAEAVTGFFTKFGDGGADICPLSGLTKRQGRQILEHLGAPKQIYTKRPTADLLDGNPGQADEDELGITYDMIDDYLEGKNIDDKAATALEARYFATEHKRTVPVTVS